MQAHKPQEARAWFSRRRGAPRAMSCTIAFWLDSANRLVRPARMARRWSRMWLKSRSFSTTLESTEERMEDGCFYLGMLHHWYHKHHYYSTFSNISRCFRIKSKAVPATTRADQMGMITASPRQREGAGQGCAGCLARRT